MQKNYVTSIPVALMGIAILVFLYDFNKNHPLGYEYIVTNIMVLLWLPMLLILLVFRQDLQSFGFAVGDMRKGYGAAGLLFLIMLPLMLAASRMPDYQSYYPMDKTALHSFGSFLRFEAEYGVYLFCWEFFFRGFLLFGLYRIFGAWSVFAQAIPFGMMHYGKPEFIGSFFSGIVLGFLAIRAKSFMPCFILHWAISVTFDAFVIASLGGFTS